MKKNILVKVITRDACGSTLDEIEVDSFWSQEAELFCERIAEVVKIFVEEMTGEADSTKSLEIIERLGAD